MTDVGARAGGRDGARALVVRCSGIGRAAGSVGREAAYASALWEEYRRQERGR